MTLKHAQEPAIIYDQKRAESFDKNMQKMAPLKDALHLCMQIVLSTLPKNAHILCVGVGTGVELLYLAKAFPHWTFTAVDPAAPMLEVCKNRIDECGFSSRCTFHNGYLDTLADDHLYDAATAILVSQFFKDVHDRQDFFSSIKAKIYPGGYLISADLASDRSSLDYQDLIKVWLRLLKYSDLPDSDVEKFYASLGHQVAVLPSHDIQRIIQSAGFSHSTLFFQSLLIHGWYSKV